ncbi:MAG TPA: Zn-ribbon domain-containing OB-fold protein [Chloroflexota bacterium]|nr:Zn-ribbon domain-containing OB-fold protein [Chloroflexota bacterium]
MTPDIKPAPVPDLDTQPFWDACKDHELRAQRCNACGRFRWPPRTFCPACYSWEYEWARLSGRGTVYSFSVVHHVVAPAFKEDAPYVVALVTLEGTGDHVQLLSNIIECPWEKVQVGMPVRVVFDDTTSGVSLPKFRPAPVSDDN